MSVQTNKRIIQQYLVIDLIGKPKPREILDRYISDLDRN